MFKHTNRITMNFKDALQWRYATKQMSGEVVPQEKLDAITEAARMAPTSSGIQPFEILVISNKALKEQIQPIAFNQPTIVQSSHLLVFAAWDHYTEERINNHFKYNSEERGLPETATDDYRKMLLNMYGNQTAEQHFTHAAKQSYIALGYATIAAALEQVDATPMEGFNPAALDELLNLKEKGLRSVSLLALGYRKPEGDWLVNLKKVRRPRSRFITEIK